jgi:HlyD family secretion protein
MNMHNPIRPEITAQPYRLDENDVRTPGRRPWLVPLLIALVVVAIVAGWSYFGRAKPVVQTPVALPRVSVIEPGQTPVADQVNVTGSIAARRDMPVGVQGEGGLVTAVLVDAGQFVKAGQVLARIDRNVQTQQLAQMAASITSARADAAIGQSELDRAGKLVGKGFIAKADIDRKTATRDAALAKVELAKAQYGEMQARLGRLDVRAPAAGLVLARNVEAGQVVSSGGTPLFRVAEGGILEMRAQVAEQDMARLKVGMPADVRPVGSANAYHGRIWLIDPVIDATSRQGIARIAVAYAPGLRVGAFANASIAAGEATQPVLPQSAVQVDGDGSYVYVIAGDGSVVRRGITVGRVSDQGVGVARGLVGNEKVVVSAAAFLRPGEKILPVTVTR